MHGGHLAHNQIFPAFEIKCGCAYSNRTAGAREEFPSIVVPSNALIPEVSLGLDSPSQSLCASSQEYETIEPARFMD
jgi:hypothetical protein